MSEDHKYAAEVLDRVSENLRSLEDSGWLKFAANQLRAFPFDSATAELRRELEEVKRQLWGAERRVVNLERGRDALKREVEELRQFARDVWTTLGKDLHHGEGFNKKLFCDRAGQFFEQHKSPRKYS